MKPKSKTIKRIRLALMAVLVLGILLVGISPQPASALVSGPAIQVNTCGAVLNIPGGQYVLAGNLNCLGSNPAVSILGEDIHFNLNGYTISGDGTGIGILVSAFKGKSPDTHINGGTVTGFLQGMLIQQSQDVHVNGMTVTGNGTGIQLDGYSIYNQINGNTITGNGGGIWLQGSNLNSIRSNYVSYNDDFGIQISTSYGDNTVQGNTTNGNSVGNYLENSVHNTVQGNTSLGNTSFDMADSECFLNVWKDNTFLTSNCGYPYIQ